MIVLSNEIIAQIKNDINLGNIVFAGSTIAQCIKNKNPFENITLALRSIKEDLKEILKSEPNYFILNQVNTELVQEVLEDLGWKNFGGSNDMYSLKYFYTNDEIKYSIAYNYKSNCLTIKKIDNEAESNNC